MDHLSTSAIRVAQRGVFTLPKHLRQMYRLKPGDTFTLIDLGGIFVLSPRHLEVDSLAEKITSHLTAKGETLGSMLEALRKERERHAHRS